MTLEQPITELEQKPSPVTYQKCNQRLSDKGRIVISKKAWVARMAMVIGVTFVMIYNLQRGLELGDPLIVYSTLMPLHALLYSIVGWMFYKSIVKGSVGNDLVSVIIPVYNQKSMIEIVIDAVYRSTYRNIEVIAVNDGSKDGTKNILDNLVKKYPSLKVIHKNNEGKRTAVAAGFYASKGKYVVLIDSDSIVDERAITEFMRTLNGDSTVGAVVAYAKVWNARKNILTKCQDVWYDFSFNIRKCTESTFGSVLCCSGCMSGYRREAIARYIPYWVKAKLPFSEDRELTYYMISPSFAQKVMESMAQYDDAEDRGLTGQALVEWKAVYVASAIVYTEAPENMKVYLKQQKRWMKGNIRVSFFLSAFFWRKNPIMSLIFYMDFMTIFTAPLIISSVFLYTPLLLQNILIPASFMAGSLLKSTVYGLDYKFRDPTTKTWMYNPLMYFMQIFLIAWLVFPALMSYRKNDWGTR